MRTEERVRRAFDTAFQVHIAVVVRVEPSLVRTHLVFFSACHTWGIRHSAAFSAWPSKQVPFRESQRVLRVHIHTLPRSSSPLSQHIRIHHTVALVFAVQDLILRAAMIVYQAGFATKLPRQAYQSRPASLCQIWIGQNFCRIAAVAVGFTIRHQDTSPPLEVAIARHSTLGIVARIVAKSTKTRA